LRRYKKAFGERRVGRDREFIFFYFLALYVNATCVPMVFFRALSILFALI